MADQFHAKFIGFVLWMSRRGEIEATSPVRGELLLLQLSIQTSCEFYLKNEKVKSDKKKGIKKPIKHWKIMFFVMRAKSFYQGQDSRIRRECLKTSTSLQIYWISQVESWHSRCNQVWSLSQHCGNTGWYEAVGLVESSLYFLWVSICTLCIVSKCRDILTAHRWNVE